MGRKDNPRVLVGFLGAFGVSRAVGLVGIMEDA